jgi:hypothetical protein
MAGRPSSGRLAAGRKSVCCCKHAILSLLPALLKARPQGYCLDILLALGLTWWHFWADGVQDTELPEVPTGQAAQPQAQDEFGLPAVPQRT